ncbi:MAG: TIGR02996 domain-containing protein [Archangium sp.]
MARDPALEAKLIDNPADHAAYLVYADWLQSHGDLRGELIKLQHEGKEDEANELIEANSDAFLGALKHYRTTFDGTEEDGLEWKRGFIKKATFSYDNNSAEDIDVEEGVEIALETGLSALLTHPSGALLEELVIPINMLDDGGYFGPVVGALMQHGAPALRRLRIGRFSCCGGPGGEGDYEYEISWTGVGDLSGLWKAVPRLEKLVIQSGMGGSSASGEEDALGTIEHANLKHLEIITGGLSQDCVRSIANAKLPNLETLIIWFGDDNYGAGGGVDDLKPLFEGAGFPKLKHLGLCNSDFADEIAQALVTAPIVARLESISLQYGTLQDGGARALAAIPNIGKLKVNISENCVGDAAAEELQAKCAGLTWEDQKKNTDRYVSLSE